MTYLLKLMTRVENLNVTSVSDHKTPNRSLFAVNVDLKVFIMLFGRLKYLTA